jgi:hypothetical protein
MLRAIILGAVLIHPILFLTVFVCGAVFGSGDVWNGGTPPSFGSHGGNLAVGNLFTIYFITLGIGALVSTAFGGFLGAGVRLFLARNRKNSTGARDRPAKVRRRLDGREVSKDAP